MRMVELEPEREHSWIEFVLVSPLILVGYIARVAWNGLITGWYMHKVKWW